MSGSVLSQIEISVTKVLVLLLCKKPTDHRTVHDISHVSLGNVFTVWSVVLFTKLYCCVHVRGGGGGRQLL